MNAISRPKRPVASASAKPRKAQVVTCAEGLRASELMSEPNTLPMPMPAPTSAMQARPAPIILADARSMGSVLSVSWRSVKVDGVAQIEARQDGEDVGLQHRNQELEQHQRRVHGDRREEEHAERAHEA